jgi:hypothetical protein
MSRYAQPRHKKAARVLGYAATLNTTDAWYAASALWEARLTPDEAAAMAWAALKATKPEWAAMAAESALGVAGAPLPTFSDIVQEAGWWADCASPDERAAYVVACFNRLSKAERAEFLAFAEARV